MSESNVLIYCEELLRPSATFIRSQAEALRQFTPYYVGTRRIRSLPLPEDHTIVVNPWHKVGIWKEWLYHYGQIAPGFLPRVRQLQPQLIHAHFGPGGVAALPLARQLKIPLIVTFHGYDATVKEEFAQHSFYSHRRYIRYKEVLKAEAARFIAVSNFIRDQLIEQGFPAEKVIVHHIGVNTQAFHCDPKIVRQPIVLFVGRLVEKKGCEYLIRAMAQVQAQHPEAELVIIGDGPLRSQLEQLATRLPGCYQFLGTQPPEVVRQWMNRAHLLCVPSITAANGDSEGSPIVILEAQAMGLPVVGSRHSGIPDVLVHGQTGLLAAERDWQGLATHILALWQDHALWQRLSEQAQQQVRSMFDIRHQTSKLEAIYQQVLVERQQQRCLGYLSGAARVSTRPTAEVKGARAHVLGVMGAFKALNWQVQPYIVGDLVPEQWVTPGSEKVINGNFWRTLAVDLLRLWLAYRYRRRAWQTLGRRPDWVYERFGTFQAMGRIFQRHGIPWILETNAPLFEEAKTERNSLVLSGLAHRLEIQAYRDCDALVCISEALKQIIVTAAQIPEHKVLVVPNGVDADRYDPQRYTPQRLFSGLTIGFVGGLFVWQGLEILLHAIAALQREGIIINLVVLGDGTMRKPWEELVKSLDISPQVKFLGWVSPAELPPYIAGFDVGYCGHEDMQGRPVYRSPLKLYEYMAMGKPILTSLMADAHTLIGNGETGFGFTAGDLPELMQALRQVYQRRDQLADMGRKARAEVLAHHSWQARVEDMIRRAEAILDIPSAPPATSVLDTIYANREQLSARV
jgi:glycosyltransferase involved in cell wall biosynthesis